MMRVGSRFLLVLCAVPGGSRQRQRAQEFRATVKGQVADTSDAALPGATVTVQNQDTNEIATAVDERARAPTRSPSCARASTP